MTESEEKEWVIKLAVLGDSGVGKTSLINQYIQHSFTADYLPTLGVNIVIKDIRIKRTNTFVRLTLWDIAGQEKYDLTRRLFFQGCEGVLLVYDITRPLTFDNIKYKWLKEFKKFTDKDCIYILIGNKVDLRDEGTISIEDRLNVMSFEKGKKFASTIKASNFIETSAKLGDNVEKAFEALYKQVLIRNGAEV